MIKDLERKITVQKKQLADLARLRQEKKRDAERITNLNNEIQASTFLPDCALNIKKVECSFKIYLININKKKKCPMNIFDVANSIFSNIDL